MADRPFARFAHLFGPAGAGPAASLRPEDFVAGRDPAGVLLDVRTPAEFAAGHLAGAVSLNVLGPALAVRLDALDRARAYYVYCGSGARSAYVARRMAAMGFPRAFDVGSYRALVRAGASVAR